MSRSGAIRKRTGARDAVITIRVQNRQRELIDRAAAVLGKNRSDFMLDAACRAAESVLLDQRVFVLDEPIYQRFVELLDAPPEPNERLRALLATKAPWEK